MHNHSQCWIKARTSLNSWCWILLTDVYMLLTFLLHKGCFWSFSEKVSYSDSITVAHYDGLVYSYVLKQLEISVSVESKLKHIFPTSHKFQAQQNCCSSCSIHLTTGLTTAFIIWRHKSRVLSCKYRQAVALVRLHGCVLCDRWISLQWMLSILMT